MKQFKVSVMFVVASIVFGISVAVAAPEVVTLKVEHFLPASSNIHKFVLLPWCEKISKESGGQLKCQIYPSMQLGGTPSQLFDQIRDGVVDIGWSLPTFQAGRFTKSEVFELPFLVRSSSAGSPALWDYIQKNALDEFKGTKLLFTHLNDGNILHLRSKQVKRLEDLKGLKIRGASRLSTQALAALGATPVQMPVSAVPEAIAKGVVDSASTTWEVSTSLKLQEICKTHTETPPNKPKMSYGFFVFAMNSAKYNSLPPNLKKVIDQNSGLEASKWAGKLFDSFTEPARKIAVERHNPINILSDAEYMRWVKATESVDDGWFKEVNAKGHNGKALLDDAKALLIKYHD